MERNRCQRRAWKIFSRETSSKPIPRQPLRTRRIVNRSQPRGFCLVSRVPFAELTAAEVLSLRRATRAGKGPPHSSPPLRTIRWWGGERRRGSGPKKFGSVHSCLSRRLLPPPPLFPPHGPLSSKAPLWPRKPIAPHLALPVVASPHFPTPRRLLQREQRAFAS